MIYVVLGMHKSGTTLISQILHESGINMVEGSDSSRSYDQGNKFERESTLLLNHRLLRATKRFSLDLERPNDMVVSDLDVKLMDKLIADCNKSYRDWGFKDPRSCLLYDVWARALPPHKIIVIHRDADEVFAHYRKVSRKRFFTVLFDFYKRWCEHNRGVLSCLKHTKMDYIVVNYEKFMLDDGEFNRLQLFVGKPLNDKRNKKLYRSRSRKSLLTRCLKMLNQIRTGDSVEQISARLQDYCNTPIALKKGAKN
jgi:hypothetical protein